MSSRSLLGSLLELQLVLDKASVGAMLTLTSDLVVVAWAGLVPVSKLKLDGTVKVIILIASKIPPPQWV